MKTLSLALQAHLIEATTTLSWCWRVSRAHGVTLGFTDHDRVLTFDGANFEPESGFAASEVRSGSDLSVDAQDAEGVLTSDRIIETDIIDGRWDAVQVELWRVNWADTSQRVMMRLGAVGQIRRGRMIKCQFGHVKTRYRGLAKNRAQLFTLFALGNLFLVRRKLRT